MLEVDLVADAGARRHDLEIVERLAAPFEELVALAVALIFELDVLLERLGVPNSSTITLWSMTRCTGTSGLIFCGSPPSCSHRVAHRREVDDRGDAGEVLHQHARRAVLDLAVDPTLLQPVGHRLEVVASDGLAVLEAKQILQQHLHREGQARNVAERLARLVQRIISVGLALDLESRAGVEAVLAGGDHRCPSIRGELASGLPEIGKSRPLATRSCARKPARHRCGEIERPLRQDRPTSALETVTASAH